MKRSGLSAILTLCLSLAGCIPFVLEDQPRHFTADEYVFPLAEGRYVSGSNPKDTAVLSRRDEGVAFAFFEEGRHSFDLAGGLIPLRSPGYFVFQVTQASEPGKTKEKPMPGTMYLPLRILGDGALAFILGPRRCDPACETLLTSHGFVRRKPTPTPAGTVMFQDPAGDWTAPKNLSRERLTAFYEDVAARLAQGPDDWANALRLVRTPPQK